MDKIFRIHRQDISDSIIISEGISAEVLNLSAKISGISAKTISLSVRERWPVSMLARVDALMCQPLLRKRIMN